MNRNKRMIGIACIAALLVLLLGCSQPQQEKAPGIRVGFSHAEVVNPWRMAQINSLRQNMEAAGCEFIYTEPLERTRQWQLNNIRQMLDDGLDFLFLIPLDTEGYEEIAEQAKVCGTQVISLGQALDGLTSGEDYLSCIYYDYALAGRLCGQTLAQSCWGKTCRVLEIQSGNPSVAQEISDGFQQAVSESRGITVVSRLVADGDRIATQKLVEKAIIELLQQDTMIDAVFAHNDEDGLGALNALKLAGADLCSIHIVSINGEQDVFKAIIAEEYLASVACSPMLGPIAYDMIRLFLEGHRISPYILIPCVLVDNSNARASYFNAY